MKKLLILSIFTFISNFTFAQTFNWPQAIEDGILLENDNMAFCNGSIFAINSDELSINNSGIYPHGLSRR